jgi:hypothetical protein
MKRRASMKGLSVVMFAAAIAIWGLVSIPDGSGNEKTSVAYRRGELARTPDTAFMAPTQKAAALRTAQFESYGAAAASRVIAGADALRLRALQVEE